MSSKSVQIIGGEDRQHAYVDGKNNALVTMDEIHAKIHKAELFTASAATSLAGDGILEQLIRVPSGATHMRFLGTVAHQMRAQLFEGPTTTADGTPLPAFNRNRFASDTTLTEIYLGPTVTVDGTTLMDFFIPGGNKQTASGGQGSSFEEWILSPGDYLVRISNNIVNPAAAGWISIVLDFYE